MIHLGRRANALGDIAPGVVHLQEVATAAVGAGRETAVPRVGDEERDIAGLDLEQNRGSTVVREIFVVHPVEGREAPRTMTAGDDRGRAVGAGAILQVDVGGHGEHRVGNAIVPRHALRAGHVWPGVAVPKAAGKRGGIAPRGVRDDVAVFAEQRFDRAQDLGMRGRGLARRTAVEHLVAELVLVTSRPFGRKRFEDRVDLLSHPSHLGRAEHTSQPRVAVALELDRCVGSIAWVEQGEILEQPADHVRDGRRGHDRCAKISQ